MALVPYDFSDSEAEYQKEIEEDMGVSNTGVVTLKTSQENLISAFDVRLPIPKWLTDGLDDEEPKFLNKNSSTGGNYTFELRQSSINPLAHNRAAQKKQYPFLPYPLSKPKPCVTKETDSVNKISKDNNSITHNISDKPATITSKAYKAAERARKSDLLKNAYPALVGRSRKAKGKKDTTPEINVVDINAKDIMPDKKYWMAQLEHEEPYVLARKMSKELNPKHKKKHHISDLARKAILNDAELKKQYALKKMAQKKAQSKYAF